jgi:hypothetical protein
MSDQAEQMKPHLEKWRLAYIEMCRDGSDPGEVADAMITFGGFMLAAARGNAAASAALTAGAMFMLQRKMQENEPNSDLPLH